jgi:hypothetical protein
MIASGTTFVWVVMGVAAIPFIYNWSQAAQGKLRLTCPNCKSSIAPGAKVCRKCGRDIPPPRNA